VKPLTLPDSYLKMLLEYSWPGNVRQLKHFAEQLSLNSTFQFSTSTLDTLFKELRAIVEPEEKVVQDQFQGTSPASLKLADPESEAQAIRNALHKAQFSKTKAAELLGVSRTTLWRKLKQLQ
jgi:transcriptional regulator with PAS, ATPase and Fis domain